MSACSSYEVVSARSLGGIVEASVSRGPNGSDACPERLQLRNIGHFATAEEPAFFERSGDGTSVQCRVVPEGDGYYVEAQMAVGRTDSLSMTGRVALTRQTQTVSMVVSSEGFPGGRYEQTDCTATFLDGIVDLSMGGFRADITCPMARDGALTCQTAARVSFQNCASSRPVSR